MAKNADSKRGSSNFSSFSDDADDTDHHLVVKDGERLVSCLPNVTHFAVILPQIYPFLLQACLVETNLNCLQHYMLFLAQNYPHEKLCESVIGISRLIVDRFDVIKKILSSSSSKQHEVANLQGSNNVVLLGSLFELFHNAMEAAIHSQTMPQLSSSAEFWLVTFPAVSQKAILHTAFIQALFLLLSLNPPPGAAFGDFTYLLDLWIPIQLLSRPEACAVESKDKLSLPPVEVLHSMLLSTNTRILEASVKVAKPSDLCKFVEQFGCPVVSVDKVLEVLDDLCNERSVATELRHIVVDPVSLSRYVESQMHRGIKNGKNFLTFIRGLTNMGLTNMSPSEAALANGVNLNYRIGGDSSLLQYCKPSTIQKSFSKSSKEKSLTYLQGLSIEEAEQHLLQIFLQFSGPTPQDLSETRRIMMCLENGIKQLLNLKCSFGSNVIPGEIYLTSLIASLHKLLSESSFRSIQLLEGMIKSRFSLTLFRVVTKLHVQDQLGRQLSDVYKDTLHDICVLLESSVHIVNKLKFFPSFIAILRNSCKKLGVSFYLEEEGVTEMASRVCKDIQIGKNPFENEPSIIKLSHDMIQSTTFLKQFESLISTLIKRSVSLNMEMKCINLLQSVKSVSADRAPVAVQYNSELFYSNKVISELSSEKSCGKKIEMKETDLTLLPCSPDMTGLLIDVFEVLDPEIINLSPETSKRFLFGCSEVFESYTSFSSSAVNYLFSGQGYLLARLVNNSSWCSLLAAIRLVLDKHNIQEW